MDPALPLGVASGLARRYVSALRRRHPGAVPRQLLHVLEKQYLLTMSVGATATGLLTPRTGTLPRMIGLSAAHLGTSGAVSTLYLLCLAEVYGLGPAQSAQLVRSCALGRVDGGILEQQFTGTWWRSALAYLPASQVRFTQRIASRSLARAAKRGGVSSAASALPAGIGGTLGFTSGRILGNRVVDAATALLGDPPHKFADVR